MDPFTIRRVRQILDGYIQLKVPVYVRDAVRLTYEMQNDLVILSEHRPSKTRRGWRGTEIVQFRLEGQQWTVYVRKDGEAWSLVDSIPPAGDFEKQLEQVELDREGLIWNLDLPGER
ncbi:DUF3024 domain-containing protein [Paenibacillus filicis]